MEAVATSNSSAPNIMPKDVSMTTDLAEDVPETGYDRPTGRGLSGGGEGEVATDASRDSLFLLFFQGIAATDKSCSYTVHITNGETEYTPAGAPTQPSGDVEMGDAEPSKEPTEAPSGATDPTVANGTPLTNKRMSTGASSKKKSSAVPEHKSKKLNKKKSKPLTNLGAQAGEYYFARMKGHPPWPSIICDEEMLPLSLLTTRPVTAALPDGSFKRADYAEGGKRAYERTFPVMFL